MRLQIATLGLLSAAALPFAAAQAQPHYVLVHGINNEGSVWNNTVTKSTLQTRDPGAPIIHPTVGWTQHIDTQVQNLYNALNQGSYASTSDIVAISYSLGGVVSRAFLREQVGRTTGPKLGTLITMGSPHAGAPILNALNAETWARLSGSLYVIAKLLLHPFGYLEVGPCNGYPECIIYNGAIDRESYYTLSWSLASALVYKRLQATKDAMSTEEYKPQSPYLAALNDATGYENGVNVGCIYGVEAYPELWYLAASTIPGQNKVGFKNLIDEIKSKCLHRALNDLITCQDYVGFGEWIAKYYMLDSAPKYWRKVVTGGAGGGSDGVVPEASEQWPRAQFNVRVDGSNHLDHMNHSVLNTRVRELLDQFAVGRCGVPQAPVGLAPRDGRYACPLTGPILSWNPSCGAASYDVELSSESAFTSPDGWSQGGIAGTSIAGPPIMSGHAYYWHVRGRNELGIGPWSETVAVVGTVPPFYISARWIDYATVHWGEMQCYEVTYGPSECPPEYQWTDTTPYRDEPYEASASGNRACVSNGGVVTQFGVTWRLDVVNGAGTVTSYPRFSLVNRSRSAPLASAGPARRGEESPPSALELTVAGGERGSGGVELSYVLPTDGQVKLGIFDLLGRRVATLLDDARAAGGYLAHWNGDGAPRGLYFARLRVQSASGMIEEKAEKVILKQ